MENSGFFFFIFKKHFGGYKFFVGPLIPIFYFRLMVMSPLGFKSEWEALFALYRGICITCSPRFMSCVTHDLLAASMTILFHIPVSREWIILGDSHQSSLHNRPCSRVTEWPGFYENKQWLLRNCLQSTVRRQVWSWWGLKPGSIAPPLGQTF